MALFWAWRICKAIHASKEALFLGVGKRSIELLLDARYHFHLLAGLMYKQTCQISPSYIMYGKNRLAETVHVSPRLSTDLKNERSRLQTEQNRAKEEQNNRDPHRCTRHPGRQAQPTHLIYKDQYKEQKNCVLMEASLRRYVTFSSALTAVT